MGNNKKGFTLIEILVVVLIIGILAAVALPHYRIAVGKSRFATLKNITRSISESANRYYMVHNKYPETYENLDVDLPPIIGSWGTESMLQFIMKDLECAIWFKDNQMCACYTNISGKLMGYYVRYQGDRPLYCYINYKDKSHITHKICQQDTGKKKSQANCVSNYCFYYY